MIEPGQKRSQQSPREGPADPDAGLDQPARPDEGSARDLKTALEGGRVDLNEVVLSLAWRLSAAEVRLSRIGEGMNQLRRRVEHVESLLAAQASQTTNHQEAIRMICTILRDLDDPYGFGLSLDERLAYDGPDRASDGGEE